MRRFLRILSFIPLVNYFVWFIYLFFLSKSSVQNKGIECIKSIFTACAFAFPIVILWSILSEMLLPSTIWYTFTMCVYLYMTPLTLSQGLLFCMKNWEDQL